MGIELTKLIEKMELTNHTPEINISNIFIEDFDVNRPALQLAGFYDYFDSKRIQAIGNVEYAYLHSMEKERRMEMLEKLFSHPIPCIVFCRNINFCDDLLDIAIKNGIPILSTTKTTTDFTSDAIRWLKEQLAEMTVVHGVLVDVFGTGIFITGDSGTGKSEAALELVKRGHRLVSDDAVVIKKISNDILLGSSPETTKNFIEVRGIGITDIKTLFGVCSVKDNQEINLNIHLEHWKEGKNYDRIGLDYNYTEILGNKVVQHKIPITPGRNVAIIVETAAVNYKQRMLGYNAAEELYKRVSNKFSK